MKRILISLALIVMLLSLSIAAQTQDMSSVNLMVTQRGIDIEFVSTGEDGVYQLYIYDVGEQTVYMMDSPSLYAGSLQTSILSASWNGAESEVENALMQFQLYDNAGDGFAVLNLSAPTYNPVEDELVYMATVSEFTLFEDDKETVLPEFVESATLFIPFNETSISQLSEASQALGLRGPNANNNCSPISPSCTASDGDTESTEDPEVTETPLATEEADSDS